MDAAEIRELFPILKKRAYMFSGGIAPVFIRHEAAMSRHMDWLSNDPDDLYVNGLDADASDCRRMFAQLMGCDQDEVAIVEGTSAGSNIAFDLINPLAGGSVVFDDSSYPSSVFPWHLPPHQDLTKRFVQARDGIMHLEDFEAAIDEGTVAVCISHVTPMEGFKQDIGALAGIAHAKGALLVVDGAQSAGAMHIDLHETGVDFFSTTAMKWLLGAAGVGFLYAARKFHNRLPSRAGYASTRSFDIHDFRLKDNAQRFELGMPSLIGLAFTKPGLEILLETDMRMVESHNLDLSGYCIAGMQERGMNVVTPESAQHRLGVIAAMHDDAQGLWRYLHDRGVDTFFHGNLFRVDPHVFNNRHDIDRFLDGLDGYNNRLLNN